MRNFDTENEVNNSKPLIIDVEINSNKIEKPWGYYIDHYRSKETVLKTIVVNPHSRLSLQSHKKRIETWAVLEGNGIVETGFMGEKLTLLRMTVGRWITVNKNERHRLINDTDKPLVIAEVQYGICEEDDIERFEDDYGR